MNVLKPLINELVRLIKKGTNLANQELPVVAEQILKFYFWASLVWVIAGLILVLGGLYFHLDVLRLAAEAGSERFGRHELPDGTCFLIMGAVLGYLGGGAMIATNLIDIIKIKAAPRLFLLEYLQNFLG